MAVSGCFFMRTFSAVYRCCHFKLNYFFGAFANYCIMLKEIQMRLVESFAKICLL